MRIEYFITEDGIVIQHGEERASVFHTGYLLALGSWVRTNETPRGFRAEVSFRHEDGSFLAQATSKSLLTTCTGKLREGEVLVINDGIVNVLPETNGLVVPTSGDSLSVRRLRG